MVGQFGDGVSTRPWPPTTTPAVSACQAANARAPSGSWRRARPMPASVRKSSISHNATVRGQRFENGTVSHRATSRAPRSSMSGR